MSDYYNPGSVPANGAFGSSNTIRSEFAAISTGISDKLPPLTGSANKVVVINGTATGQTTQATNGTGNIVRATGAAIDLASATNLPVAQLTGLAAGVAAFLATPSSANLATAVTGETGLGALVFGTSPTISSPVLSSPTLGTPVSGTLTNTTGFPTANLAGLGAGMATFLASPTSANLAATLTNETGSGSAVFANSPTLVSPDLGTPSAINLTNASGFNGANITGTVQIANGGTAANSVAGIVANLGILTNGGANGHYQLPNGFILKFGNQSGTTDASGNTYHLTNATLTYSSVLCHLVTNTNSAATKAIPTLVAMSGTLFTVNWSDGTSAIGAGVAINVSYLIIGV